MALASDLVQIGFNATHAKFLGDRISDSISAAGTGQATSTELTGTINHVVSRGASAYCVKLPLINGILGSYCVVHNDSSGVIVIYPGLGDQINNFSTNYGVQVGSNRGIIFFKVSASKWLGILGDAIAAAVSP